MTSSVSGIYSSNGDLICIAGQLKEKTLDFEQIVLDPNNPRFWTEKGSSRDSGLKSP